MRAVHWVYGDFQSSAYRLCQLIWLQSPPQWWLSAPTCPPGWRSRPNRQGHQKRQVPHLFKQKRSCLKWSLLHAFHWWSSSSSVAAQSLAWDSQWSQNGNVLSSTPQTIGLVHKDLCMGTCKAIEWAKQILPAKFPSPSSQCPREWQRRRTSPRAPATQTASFSWVDDFKTTNEVYNSSFFLGESLLIFNLSPHRLTQHLCFNLIHSEFVSSMLFLGLNPSSSSSQLLLPCNSITGLALI